MVKMVSQLHLAKNGTPTKSLLEVTVEGITFYVEKRIHGFLQIQIPKLL